MFSENSNEDPKIIERSIIQKHALFPSLMKYSPIIDPIKHPSTIELYSKPLQTPIYSLGVSNTTIMSFKGIFILFEQNEKASAPKILYLFFQTQDSYETVQKNEIQGLVMSLIFLHLKIMKYYYSNQIQSGDLLINFFLCSFCY